MSEDFSVLSQRPSLQQASFSPRFRRSQMFKLSRQLIYFFLSQMVATSLTLAYFVEGESLSFLSLGDRGLLFE